MPRSRLGGHHGFRSGQLHQLEAAALVLRAGRAAGMIVRTEHQVDVVSLRGVERSGEIDICWFHAISNRLLVAWEVDGRDADRVHILGGGSKDVSGNRAKLSACGADIKVQVLYSLKNDLSPKDESRREEIATWLPGVELVTDEELMMGAPEGIDGWIQRALALPP